VKASDAKLKGLRSDGSQLPLSYEKMMALFISSVSTANKGADSKDNGFF